MDGPPCKSPRRHTTRTQTTNTPQPPEGGQPSAVTLTDGSDDGGEEPAGGSLATGLTARRHGAQLGSEGEHGESRVLDGPSRSISPPPVPSEDGREGEEVDGGPIGRNAASASSSKVRRELPIAAVRAALRLA